MMPGIDSRGFRIIRRQKYSYFDAHAKSEDMDKILGLSTGADDYLTEASNPGTAGQSKILLERYLYLNPNYKQNNAGRKI